MITIAQACHLNRLIRAAAHAEVEHSWAGSQLPESAKYIRDQWDRDQKKLLDYIKSITAK